MSTKKSTMRVSMKATAFFNKIREKKTERFRLKYTNDTVMDELLHLLEEHPELIKELIELMPGQVHFAAQERAEQR